MQYALPLVLPDVPAGGVCAGIDWATADHAGCVVDMAGRVTGRFSAAHDKAGIAAMITWLRRNKVTEVAIERGDGPLVDALLAAGLTVVVGFLERAGDVLHNTAAVLGPDRPEYVRKTHLPVLGYTVGSLAAGGDL